MTRAIIFDFGNVVCRFEPRLFVERLFHHARRPLRSPREALHQSSGLGRDYETGLISSAQFFERICDRYDLVVDKRDFIDAFVHIFTPIPSTFDLVRRLKPRYGLGLLSNTNEWHFEFGIKPVEVYPLFDAVTLSFQVKAMKPDERMYEDIVHKLGIKPEEAVYIDDLEENVRAGRQFGMKAIHYVSPEQCLTDLRRWNVAV